MTLDLLMKVCESFPHSKLDIKWGSDRVYIVAEKMFATVGESDEDGSATFSCKAEPSHFEVLVGREDIDPAPYLARAHWIRVNSTQSMDVNEVHDLLRESYDLVVAKLPKRTRVELGL